MDDKIIHEKQDLTHLTWSRYRHTSGTAGSFLKAYSDLDGTKKYYKMSNYEALNGVVGHESVNEIIVDRLLTTLGIDHVPYRLINADIVVDGARISTYICVSEDFKRPGERKVAFDIYYQQCKKANETPIEFCHRMGWTDIINSMLMTDFLILNRDRHGANIEVLKGSGKSVRLAPLYDHGLSLMFSCHTDSEMEAFDIMADLPVQSFIGGRSAYENMKLISGSRSGSRVLLSDDNDKSVSKTRSGNLIQQSGLDNESVSGTWTSRPLQESDRDVILFDLEGVLPDAWLDKIWKMIWERWRVYEDLQNYR